MAVTPKMSDGKPFFAPNSFPEEVLLNFTGVDDTADQRFHGELFLLTVAPPTPPATFRTEERVCLFKDGIYLAGGHVSWEGGASGAEVYMEILAPASTTKAPASQGTGNCNKVPTGLGFNLIVPAAGNGEFDLDAPVPVPAFNDETNAQTGYWNYSEPWTGKGTCSAGVSGASKYNLYDIQLELVHFVKLHLWKDVGERDLIAPAIKPKWILPEWQIVVKATNKDSIKTLKVGWDMLIARRKTV